MFNENSVAPAFEAAAGATSADVRLVQVTGAVKIQRLTRGADSHQEEKDEVAVMMHGLGGLEPAVVADAVAVAAPV